MSDGRKLIQHKLPEGGASYLPAGYYGCLSASLRV